MIIEIEIDHTVETEIDNILDLIIGDNHKTDTYNMDVTIGEIEGDKILKEMLVMTDMTVEIRIGLEKEKEA